MDETVTVIGAGSWGTTLAKILGENGRGVVLWAREEEVARELVERHTNERYLPGVTLPRNVEGTGDLERACRGAGLVLLVVPSHGLREVARRAGEWLRGEQVVVHCTKGLEEETFERMSEVIREETCVRKIGVLSGPNLARELAAGKPAGTLVASRFDEVVARAQAALSNPYFRVYGGRDVAGAEVGGAFKNIVALAAGMAEGLGFGDNTKALLMTRGLAEMASLGAALGADWLTFSGLAGIGDLMVTCSSPLSRNHELGVRLARGESLADIQASTRMVAEGVRTTAAVHAFAEERRMELPIVDTVHAVLYRGETFEEAVGTMMRRPVGRELPAFEVTP